MRSEASFDSLFGDDPDGDGENAQKPTSLHIPSSRQSTFRDLKSPATTIPGSAGAARSGPPTLGSDAYGAFSPDVLMTASVDGSVVLWDRRVNTPGMGVGRLETSSKTPPWCVSVGIQVFFFSWVETELYLLWRRHAGLRMVDRSTRDDVIALLMSGTRGCSRHR